MADRDRGVTAVPLRAADGDRAGAGQQADSPHVMMQVIAAEADVAEQPFAGPDAVGEPVQPGKGDREGQGAAGLTGVCGRFGSAPFCRASSSSRASASQASAGRSGRTNSARPGVPGGLSLDEAPHCARRASQG